MKIGIFGTRGIPNHYGGFEQFAEIVSAIWAEAGHQVSVYCSHNHPFGKGKLGKVERILIYDPEHSIGTAGQFVYDALCIIDARKRNFDVLLQLGYTSSAVWHWLIPRKPLLFTNMDGLEWKRTKFSPPVQRAIRWFESLAVKNGGYLIADSEGIQTYLTQAYGAESRFIAYGAEPVEENLPTDFVRSLGLEPGKYNLIIARLEPENHVETILKGIRESGSNRPTIIVGGLTTPSSATWKSAYSESNFYFAGGIYEKWKLDQLRQHCYLYYHGHSVGGTNPSLLEAMAAGALVCANHNAFNLSVTGKCALYFSTAEEVAATQHADTEALRAPFIEANRARVGTSYSWPHIAAQYLSYFQSVKDNGRK